MDLPRGDVSRHKSVIKAAITKVRLIIHDGCVALYMLTEYFEHTLVNRFAQESSKQSLSKRSRQR